MRLIKTIAVIAIAHSSIAQAAFDAEESSFSFSDSREHRTLGIYLETTGEPRPAPPWINLALHFHETVRVIGSMSLNDGGKVNHFAVGTRYLPMPWSSLSPMVGFQTRVDSDASGQTAILLGGEYQDFSGFTVGLGLGQFLVNPDKTGESSSAFAFVNAGVFF